VSLLFRPSKLEQKGTKYAWSQLSHANGSDVSGLRGGILGCALA
jgi:hypothetical protein